MRLLLKAITGCARCDLVYEHCVCEPDINGGGLKEALAAPTLKESSRWHTRQAPDRCRLDIAEPRRGFRSGDQDSAVPILGAERQPPRYVACSIFRPRTSLPDRKDLRD